MFLSDSLLTSQDIDGCRQMFSACIFCFDVARQSCDCLILLRWRQVDPGRCVWCRRVRQGPNIPGGTSLLIRGGCVLCTLVDLYSLAVLQWAQNYKTYHWRIQPLRLLHSLNLVILQTRPWLDDIFNLFVQRSLAYWGKGKKRERWAGRKMSRHRSTFVSGAVRCVAVIYGSTYVCDMKGHSSHSSSVRGRRTPAEEFQCDTWAMHHGVDVPPWRGEARSTHPPRILRTLSVGIRMHKRCPQRLGSKRGLSRGNKL